MLKKVSKLHLYFAFLVIIINFAQAYNNWDERFIFSLVSLGFGIVLLILSILVIIKKRLSKR